MSLATILLTLAAPPADADVPTLARAALDGSEVAVDRLRALGQPGFDALLALRRELSSVPPVTAPLKTPSTDAWEALLDRVARQRYASVSGLYWYTDLEAAKATARREGKPILSLRLLGALDEHFSCANSRFFRTILYPDPQVSTALHDGWVLHWESVREAPKIEIDFGDGRTLVRTITGNSLHYALSPDGEIVDVMPGMVGPAAFASWLARSGEAVGRVTMLPAGKPRTQAIRAHLEADRRATLSDWRKALGTLGVRLPASDLAGLSAATDDAVLARLAAERRVRISNQAAALMDRMTTAAPGDGGSTLLAPRAMRLAVTKAVVETPMLRLLSPVAGNIARDEVKNTFEMRARLLEILLEDAGYQVDSGVRPVTEAIYALVFLTPLDDPWMGLAPADVFSALPVTVERTTAGR